MIRVSNRAWDLKTAAVTVVALSAGTTLYALFLWLRAKATLRWRPVDGQITNSSTEVWETYRRSSLWRKRVPVYRPNVTYVYTVGGTDHEGTRIFFGDGAWNDSRDVVTAILDRYPPGKKLKVYSSPTSPKESVLERGQQRGTRKYVMLAAQLLGFALLFWFLSKALV